MPQAIGDRSVFSLKEVTGSIQRTLSQRYTRAFWVRAEMNKLNYYKHSGHCYPELLEKESGKVVAQMRGIMWRDTYARVNQMFLNTLREPLRDGIKILFLARITFDAVHGLSLVIEDVDPVFTLGDLEAEKQETIRRLQTEHIFVCNKKLPFPLLPQRLAIISVETSKGYADFLNTLNATSYGKVIYHVLFPAILQGEKAVSQILRRLQQIERQAGLFDAVVILRGGGGEVGLSAFNNYELSKAVALFPLPVLTGIGHATNLTVVEQVAYFNGITPTAVAEFIVDRFVFYDEALQRAAEVIQRKTKSLVQNHKTRLEAQNRVLTRLVQAQLMVVRRDFRQLVQRVRPRTRLFVSEQHQEIRLLGHSLRHATLQFHQSYLQKLGQLSFVLAPQIRQSFKGWLQQLNEKRNAVNRFSLYSLNMRRLTLQGVEKQVKLLSPENVLKRGYSITLLNGKALKNPQEAKTGDRLTTLLAEGSLESIVS